MACKPINEARFLIFLLLSCCSALTAQTYDLGYMSGQLFIKVKDDAPVYFPAFKYSDIPNPDDRKFFLSSAKEKYSLANLERPFDALNEDLLEGDDFIRSLKNTYRLHFDKYEKTEQLIKEIRSLDFVEYVERVPANGLFYTPNEPGFSSQYALQNIKAEDAWNIWRGGSNVVVAIVDDAVMITHEDLSGKLWVNNAEASGSPNVDDDGNGYVDDINGWDVANWDNNPNPPGSATNNSFTHGTHCAGIAVGATDNGKGIASIGFNVSLMAVKSNLDSNPGPSMNNPYDGVVYAIAARVNVISMSWGGGMSSATNQAIFDLAYANNIVCVAAAGNDDSNSPKYPASYNHVISVAAVDVNDTRAYFSNYGSTVDVSAPGADIYSTLAGSSSSYGNKSGTSMACPLVAGLAGLMLSYNPALSPDDVEDCIKTTADNIDAQNPSYIGQLGAGRINAFLAMTCLAGPPIAEFTSNITEVCPGLTVQFTDQSYRQPTSWNWSFPGGTPASSNAQNPVVTYNTPGTYNVSLTVSNANGTDNIVKTGYITVGLPQATLSGGGIINIGGLAFITVTLTGTPPWSITYTDGSNNYSVTGITSSPHYINVNPTATTTYTLAGVQSSQCSGTVSGSAVITVSQGCRQSVNFQKIFGGWARDIPSAIYQTTDCGYIVAGTTSSYGAGAEDGFLAKLDTEGKLQWFKTYGDLKLNRLEDVVVLSDGYMAIGETILGNHIWSSVYLVRTDLSGNLLWSKWFNNNVDYPNLGRYIIEAADGNIVIAIRSRSTGLNNTGQSLVKLDRSTGNILWKTIVDNDFREESRTVRQTSDGGYIVCGESWASGSAGLWDATLIKFNSAGVRQWFRFTGGTQSEITGDMVIADDGGFVVAGYTFSWGAGKSDMYVYKTDAGGNLLWSKTFGGPEDETGEHIAKSCDGGYYVIGKTLSFGAGGYDTYIVKIDDAGNYLWSKTIGGEFDDVGTDISATGDCGVAITISTLSFGEGQDDVHVIKTDSLFNVSCLLNSPLTQVAAPNSIHSIDNPAALSDVAQGNYTIVNNTYNPPVVDSVCNACRLPVADFDYIVNTLSVYFINNSTADDWRTWRFGDGQTDTLSEPIHEYSAPGTYTVMLIVNNPCGADTASRIITITGLEECIHTMQPGPIKGKDTFIWSRPDALDVNYANLVHLFWTTWTWSGTPGTIRTLIEFDLSKICDTATLLDGKISLYYPDLAANASTPHSGANAAWIQRVTSQWTENTVTWNTQPTITNVNQITLPATASATQDLVGINVRAMIQDMISINNYGMLCLLQTESTYRNRCYASSDYWVEDHRPKLELKFDPIYAYVEQGGTICSGDSIALSAAGYRDSAQTSGANVAVRYKWWPSDGLTCDDCPNPIAFPDTTTEYTVAVYSCANCADIAKVTVYVKELSNYQELTSCDGDSVMLSSAFASIAGTVYNWTPSTGLSNPNIANPKASPPGQTLYIGTATDPSGCITVDSILVIVADKPVVSNLDTHYTCINGQDSFVLSLDSVVISNYFYEWTPAAGVSDPYRPNPWVRINVSTPDTFSFTRTVINFDNCADVDITLIIVMPSVEIFDTVSICSGDSVLIGGAYRYAGGDYVDSIAAISSCDSIIRTHLIVTTDTSITIDTAICDGQSYFAGGAYRTTSGTYYDTLAAVNACESIVITNLFVLPGTVTNMTPSVCDGESHFAGGAYQTSSGTYIDVFTDAHGCDSVVVTDLTVLSGTSVTVHPAICEGESYFAGSANQTVIGIYTDTLTGYHGCDSVIVTELTVIPDTTMVINVTICNGESYFAGGDDQMISGVYNDTLASYAGCDSVVITNLTVISDTIVRIPVIICEGESYYAGGSAQTSAGSYSDTLASSPGCDSIVITDLSVLPDTTVNNHATICHGKSYFAGGTVQTTTGIYSDTIAGHNTCDSIVITHLTVLPENAVAIDTVICKGEDYIAGGVSQTETGVYRDSVIGSNGCDSIITTNLTVIGLNSYIDAIGTLPVNAGDSIRLIVNSDASDPNFIWAPSSFLSCNACSDPFSSPDSSIAYDVIIEDRHGCRDTASILIPVVITFDPNSNCEFYFYMPNAFSPNDDGINDKLEMKHNGVDYFELKIFNRWGENIFETPNPSEKWDGTYRGKLLPPDVFAYSVNIIFCNGSEDLLSGSITLLR